MPRRHPNAPSPAAAGEGTLRGGPGFTALALCVVVLAACGGAASTPAAPASSAVAPPSAAAAAKPPAVNASAATAPASAKPAPASAATNPAASAATNGSAGAATNGLASAGNKAATPILIGYPGVSMGDLQAWVATDAKIWEKHNLAADVRSLGQSSAAMAALVSNQAQIIQVGGSDAVSAKAAGADVVVLAVPIPTYSYVLEVPASIKTPEDLKGKKLAVDSFGSPPDVAIRVALRKDGLDPDKDVSILAVGDVPTRTAALMSGAVQGTMLNPPYTLDVETKGYHPVIDLAALKLPYVNASPMTLRSYITAHKEVVQSYIDAFIEANNRVRHDKAFTEQVMSKYLKLNDQNALDATYDYYIGKIYPAVPTPKPELFKDAIDQLATQNKAIAGFDANTIIDGSFVQSAVDRGLIQN
ncbi:MAG: ABC transporter substrate-binding protein [Chloroflexota bacterium]